MSTVALTTRHKEASATADACAKINLTLDVLSRRDDGYHELRSLVIGIDLRDNLRGRVTPDSELALECSNPTLSGRGNLAFRAAAERARHWDLEPAVRIHL